MSPIKPSRWLMQQAKKAKAWLRTSVLLALAYHLLTIVFCGLLAYIIYAAYILKYSFIQLWPECLYLLFVIVLRPIFLWGKEITGFRVSAIVRASLRHKLLEQINLLGPVGRQQFSIGELSTVILEQIEALNNFYAYYLPQMYLVAIVPLIILGVVFHYNWLSGVVLLICGPLIPFFMALVGMGAAAANKKNFATLSKMSTHFLDTLQGLTTLKLFNRSKEQVNSIAAVSDQYRRETMSVLRIAFMSSGVLEFFSAGSIALVAMLLGLSLLGKIDFGFYHHITLFNSLFILLLAPEFFLPLRELGTQYHARAEAIAAAEKIIPMLNLVPQKTEVHPAMEVPFSLNENKEITLSFQNVSFAYASRDKEVLKDISFSIKTGEQLYIVGGSGEGKTTILNLLMGFLKPGSGIIKINEQDLSNIKQVDWLKQIAWLSQNPKLFHGTVIDNLYLAKPDASVSEMRAALKLAQMDSFIASLPQGLQTGIGEQSLNISGGQSQRVALARAFLKNAPIFLLDEPTASLDEVIEQKVLSAIHEFSKHKIMIMLTHRLHIIPKHAMVAVLSGGLFIEYGRCEELLAKDSQFKKMYELETS